MMKWLLPTILLSWCSLACPICLVAQDAGPVHAPDGRAPQFISPLYLSPKANAPFTAVAKTVWVRNLPDGSTVTSQNERHIARDAEGRIFEERVTFVPVPNDGTRTMRVQATDYSDPVDHTRYHCDAFTRVCNLFAYFPQITEAVIPVGVQPDRTSYLTRENLGIDTFAGLQVQRSREIATLYSGSVGNTKNILRTVDYWYSPELGVNVQVKRHDPRDGDQTLWISDISLSAPDVATFRAPADYRIIDHRTPEPVGGEQSSEPR